MTNKTTKTTKKFYAAYHSYGASVVNDVAYIVRFDSRAARDAYVDGERVGIDGNLHRERVTRDEARRLFPLAFRMSEWRDGQGVRDMRDWHCDKQGEEFFAAC